MVPVTNPARLLPAARWSDGPWTDIRWADGGRTRRAGHLTPEDLVARYGSREALTVTHTSAAVLNAAPGVLAHVPPVR